MNQTSKDILINRVIALFNSGQIKKCLKETLRTRKIYPDEPFIYNLLGVLYSQLESYQDSIKNYSKAIKLNPNYFEAYNNIGVAYTSWEKNDEAIKSFDKAIKINPSYAEAYNNKGNALKEKGEHQLAAACHEKAIKLNPNYIEAITNLAIVYEIMGNFTKAEIYFSQALSLDPTNTSLLYNLSNCLFNSKDYKRAIEVCRKIIDLDPSFYYAYNRMGLCCIKLEIEEEAKKLFEKAIDVNPVYAEGLTNYGLILQKGRNYPLASVQFEKVLSIDPNSDEALVNLSKVYFDEGRLSKSIEIAKKGLSLKQFNIPLLKNLIASLLLLNSFDEAAVECKKILSIEKNDPDTINLMGTILEKQGHYEQAKNHFLRAIELNENFVLAKLNIASLYLLEGNIDEATRVYVDIEEEQSDNPEVLYKKSVFALKMENFKEGWRYYENRWKVFPMKTIKWPIQNKPVWQGERGKRVSLWMEQGIGDQIISLSLLSEVKQMCSILSVYVDPRLKDLCKRAMPEIDFVYDLEVLENTECDYHLPLGSVPGLIRNDISDFDRTAKGYFKADPQRVEAIRNELNLDGKTVIGISWKSFKSLNQEKKSVSLLDMERIFSGLDVVLVNLQYGDVDDEIRQFKEVTGIDIVQCASVDNREDLDGLAALIEVCDLVVSTSNVTIHMAGALAKDTWVMLPRILVNFWWLVERTDSIWYPSLTLYRQSNLDDWDSVYVSIRKDLQSKLH